jgi:hypothetical protein
MFLSCTVGTIRGEANRATTRYRRQATGDRPRRVSIYPPTSPAHRNRPRRAPSRFVTGTKPQRESVALAESNWIVPAVSVCSSTYFIKNREQLCRQAAATSVAAATGVATSPD